MKKGFIAFVKALLGVAKVVLAILGVLALAVVASLLLSIPGGKRFSRYCSYPDMKDFDDPAVPLEKRGIKFVCTESVAAKTGPEKPKQDAPMLPCPGVGAVTTAWDVLTNVCHSVGCQFEVVNGEVEIGE